MASHPSIIGELLGQAVSDLERELRQLRLSVSKMRLDLELRKEKDSAKYRRDHRRIALLETALTQKRRESLHSAKNSSTVPARADGTPKKKGASRSSSRVSS